MRKPVTPPPLPLSHCKKLLIAQQIFVSLASVSLHHPCALLRSLKTSAKEYWNTGNTKIVSSPEMLKQKIVSTFVGSMVSHLNNKKHSRHSFRQTGPNTIMSKQRQVQMVLQNCKKRQMYYDSGVINLSLVE